MRALVLGVCLASAGLAHADRKVEAQMLCGVLKGGGVEYVVPTTDGRKLTKPIACAIQVTSGGADLEAQIWAQVGESKYDAHAGPIAKGTEYAAELRPGTDFRSCENFDIHAEIRRGDKVLWQSTTAVAQSCAASAPAAAAGKKVKASFECKQVLKDDSRFAIADGYRIDGERIECSLTSHDSRLMGGYSVVKTTWHKGTILQSGKEHHGSPIAEGNHYEYMFVLDKGVDWDTCATDVTVPVTVYDTNGGITYQTQKLYRQNCQPIPVAPPVGSHPVAAGDSARWDDSAKAQIPAEAQAITQRFIEAAVDGDPEALGLLAERGIKKGKRTLQKKDVYDLATATGIRPQSECESEKSCKKWMPWSVIVKSPRELWIYSPSDSGYGKFACAVFEKLPDGWRWTSVRSYDTGEP